MIGVVLPDLSAADAMRAAGADYVEPYIVGNFVGSDGASLDREPDGLRCPSFAVSFPGTIRLSDPAVPQEVVAAYAEVMATQASRAAAPGAFVVLGSAGARRIADGVERTAAEETFARNVRVASEVLAGHGLELILEPLNPSETNIVNSLAEALDLLDRHGLEHTRVVWDTYHAHLCGDSPELAVANLPRIAHMHHSGPERRPPSQGASDQDAMLRAALGAGYTGHVSLECHLSDLVAVADSLRELRGVLAGSSV